jgi:hypothetical protein
VRLALDETDLLLLLPPLRAGWALRGQPAPVALSGQNARRTVFGSWPKVLLAAKTYASVFYDKLPWPIARA